VIERKEEAPLFWEPQNFGKTFLKENESFHQINSIILSYDGFLHLLDRIVRNGKRKEKKKVEDKAKGQSCRNSGAFWCQVVGSTTYRKEKEPWW